MNHIKYAAALRKQINLAAINLEALSADYADSDRQDAELRAAIRRQKTEIRHLEFKLTEPGKAES